MINVLTIVAINKSYYKNIDDTINDNDNDNNNTTNNKDDNNDNNNDNDNDDNNNNNNNLFLIKYNTIQYNTIPHSSKINDLNKLYDILLFKCKDNIHQCKLSHLGEKIQRWVSR